MGRGVPVDRSELSRREHDITKTATRSIISRAMLWADKGKASIMNGKLTSATRATSTVSVRVKRLGQLFKSLDPSPS